MRRNQPGPKPCIDRYAAEAQFRAGRSACIRAFLLGWFLLSAPNFAPAMLPDQETSPYAPLPPGLEIRVDAQPREATVGDLIRLDFDIILPQGYRVSFPQLSGQAGEFTILHTYPGPEIPEAPAPSRGPRPDRVAPDQGSAGLSHYRARVVAAVYKTGEFDFPSLALVIQGPGGKNLTVSSQPVRVRISSVLAPNDNDLRDLKKQVDIEDPVRWLMWTAIGLAGLAAAIFYWWWRKRRNTRQAPAAPMQPAGDPLDEAEAELRALFGRDLAGRGMLKQFYVHVAEIIKRALAAGHRIQTVEKTTVEIMSELRDAQPPGAMDYDPAGMERIETFLLSCDMVKFARYLPSAAEAEGIGKEAFWILEECRNRRSQSMPGAVPAGGAN